MIIQLIEPAKPLLHPLYYAYQGGSFIFMTHFSKPPFSLDDQIETLKSRGLHFTNTNRVKRYLSHIGYYRLSGYCQYFQHTSGEKKFVDGTSFQTILNHYNFDRHLRIVLMDAIERVEVAFRTQLSNVLADHIGPHWFNNRNYLHSDFISYFEKNQTAILDSIKRSENQPFVRHYRNTYSSPAEPPTWMVIELMSFGFFSKVYSQLQKALIKKEISKPFNLSPTELQSWIRSLVYLRNLCAHHLRLWNAPFVYDKPYLSKMITHQDFQRNKNDGLFCRVLVLEYFMKIIAPNSSWSKRLIELIDKYQIRPPKDGAPVDLTNSGFKENWRDLFTTVKDFI